MIMNFKFIFSVLFIFTMLTVDAQIVINEYSTSNLEKILDNYNKTEDWIELYNTSSVDVDISGWHLSDKTTKSEKWEIPSGTIIEANGFLIFWCSGRDESINNHFHTNFKLSQTSGKDYVVLANPDGDILDELELLSSITLTEHSNCRKVDGGDEWAITTNPTPKNSNNGSPQYKSYTIAPTIELEAGFYEGEQSVSIVNNEPNSVLRYTTDGSLPTDQSPEYTTPIVVSKTTVIKALSISNDATILTGKMDFSTYFINEDFSVAVFSVASEDVIRLANGNGDLIPIGSIEYFDSSKKRAAVSYGSLNRHGQDSWVLDHRSIDWVSRDEMGYSKAVNAPLFSYSDRDEYQKFMFRNSGDDNYPANDDSNHAGSTHIRDEYVQTLALEGDMKLDTRAVERVVLFLNGEYWGLYGMRERPVDHDYTDEYYKQGKYDLHFLSTWGQTQAQYGGKAAFDDWFQLRDFILENDMGVDANYEIVKDQLSVLSLIDYFIANLNVVAKDWLNYNTGWWRGLRDEKDHSKWGYLLWDMDATFGYYINYSGVPNDSPNAEPCDLNDISDYMDSFFGDDNNTNPEDCQTIINGSCPYDAADSIFLLVINDAQWCCNWNWNENCQTLYDNYSDGGIGQDTCASILNGSCPYSQDDEIFKSVIKWNTSCCSGEWDQDCQNSYDEIYDNYENGLISGNVGKHEKIILKLQEENEEFRQLYYSRNADLRNTVYSCQNMNETMDRMLGVITPEMPRQIDRWGGTMEEWEENVTTLRTFIDARCELLDDGMISCFDLEGPYDVTVKCEPEEVGKIKLNTLKLKDLPWSGSYYGGMDNLLSADVKKDYEDDYRFDHWESKSGNIIGPDITAEEASIRLTNNDTLIAVFSLISGVDDLSNKVSFDVFPNPTMSQFSIKYDLTNASNVDLGIYTILGAHVLQLNEEKQGQGAHVLNYNIKELNLKSGVYMIRLMIDGELFSKKLTILE